MTNSKRINNFKKVGQDERIQRLEPFTHVYCQGAICQTETRGYANPQNRSPVELVVDSTDGFITLWEEGVTLNWRFQSQSLTQFQDIDTVKNYVRKLLGDALLAWGVAVPVRFSETREPWDFEIVLEETANCNAMGCVLASAFFPDSGQHELVLFPTLFEQDYPEQVETMAHELGHIFGLRHFFAAVDEAAFPSEIFGTHSKFTIMNYGPESRLTDTDRDDLERLYQSAWDGELTQINGTPIKFVQPYSAYQPFAPPAGVFTKKAAKTGRG